MSPPTLPPLGFPSGLEGISSIDWEAEYDALVEPDVQETAEETAVPPSSDEDMSSTPPGSPTSSASTDESSDCSVLPDCAIEDLAAYANEASDAEHIEEANTTPAQEWEHPGCTWKESASWVEWTSTSPEVCAWFLSPAILEDAQWIIEMSLEGDEFAHNDIPRIAALLRCAFHQCYVVDETAGVQFPALASGYKAFLREESQGPAETFKRGSKGFKTSQDPEIQLLEPYVPLGESVLAKDRRPLGKRWYFPQPSRLSYVWNANEDEDEGEQEVPEDLAYSSSFDIEVPEESGSDGSGNWAVNEESSEYGGKSPIDSMDTSMESIVLSSPPDHESQGATNKRRATVPVLKNPTIRLIQDPLADEPMPERPSNPLFGIYNESDDPFTDATDRDDSEDITAIHFNNDPVDGEFDVSDDAFDNVFNDAFASDSDEIVEGSEASNDDIIEATEAGNDDTTNDEPTTMIAIEAGKVEDDRKAADHVDSNSSPATPSTAPAIFTPPAPRTPVRSRDSLLHDPSPKLTGTGRSRTASLGGATTPPVTPTKPSRSSALKDSASAKKLEPAKTLYQGFFEEHGGVEANVEEKSVWSFGVRDVVGAVCGVIRGVALVGNPILY